jgi:hypothetical protein
MLASSQIAAVAMIPDFANSAIKGRSCIVKSGSFRRLVKLFSFSKVWISKFYFRKEGPSRNSGKIFFLS